MTGTAPNCQMDGCKNTTWSDSGLCYQHEGYRHSIDPMLHEKLKQQVVNRSGNAVGTSEHISENIRSVFPDIEDPISVETIREQTEHSVRAAVSIEVYRRFPETDTEDPGTRLDGLIRIEEDIAAEFSVRPVTFGVDTARQLSYSSVDKYGRDIEDTSALTSYGVIQEWSLAKSQGLDTDPYGIPYGSDSAAYCKRVTSRFQRIARDEFRDQIGNSYPRVIKEVTGRAPLSQSPLVEGQDMDPEILAPRVQEFEHAGRQSEVTYSGMSESTATITRQRSAPTQRQTVQQPVRKRGFFASLTDGSSQDRDASGKRYGIFNPPPETLARIEQRRKQEDDDKFRRDQEIMAREGAKYYRRRNRRRLF